MHEPQYLLGQCGGENVKVLGLPPQQQVPQAATNDVGLEPWGVNEAGNEMKWNEVVPVKSLLLQVVGHAS